MVDFDILLCKTWFKSLVFPSGGSTGKQSSLDTILAAPETQRGVGVWSAFVLPEWLSELPKSSFALVFKSVLTSIDFRFGGEWCCGAWMSLQAGQCKIGKGKREAVAIWLKCKIWSEDGLFLFLVFLQVTLGKEITSKAESWPCAGPQCLLPALEAATGHFRMKTPLSSNWGFWMNVLFPVFQENDGSVQLT